MKDKNIFSKFTLQAQTKYENTKIPACLEGLWPFGMLKIYSAKVFHCQNSDISEVSIALVW